MDVRSSFLCTPDKVKEVREWIAVTLAAHAVEQDIINKVLLAASEAITNCVVHAYKPAREGRVDISIDFGDGDVELTVRDYGSGLHMEQYDTPDTEKASEGGYGIYLMRSLMDDVRLRPQPDGTELSMRIRTRQAHRE
jgi:anti-sigma regulatory factor (Ser/Thr protein kinase)